MAEYVIRKSTDPTTLKVNYKEELNQEQLDVVQRGDGPVLVLAGAGSGKTRTIVYRVAYLLEQGVKADNILLVTFTNKASREMLTRVEELLGSYPKGLWGGTFHHIANILLRRFGNAIGFPPNFTILDEEDAKSLINVCVKEEGIDTKGKRFPSAAVVKSILSLCINTQSDLRDILEKRFSNFLQLEDKLEAVQKQYAKRKKKNHLVDFDDMLYLLDQLLQTRSDIREKLATQFKYVLVDEYQDTNRLQSSIVRQLASVHGNLLVVGDDAQSIYAFRGATVQNILDFPQQYPSCQTFKLETNYRSIKPVLEVANDVIRHNPDQFEKTLHPIRHGAVKPLVVPASSSEQEAEFIAQRVLEFREEGIPLQNIAVLFRASYQSQSLEFELTRRDIPYDYRGGLRFFERAHIKDLLAYLKLLDNPRDEVAFLRVIQLYPGIGVETGVKLWRECLSDLPSAEELAGAACENALTQRSSEGFRSFQKTLKKLLQHEKRAPNDLIQELAKGEYREYLQVTYPNANERIDDLLELARFAERYEKLSEFLAEVSLQESFGVVTETGAASEDEAMVVSSIHQAKGLEWDVVFVIACNDGSFPNPRALKEEGGIEEERRLFYVAVTRAKTHLFLSYSIGVNMRSTAMYMQRPSPFITELPEHLYEELTLTEERGSPDDFFIEMDSDGEPKSVLDILLEEKKQRRSRGRG